jgi:hypothetical protein
MDMNVNTGAINKGVRSLKAHSRNIENVFNALMHNVKLARGGFNSINYDRTLQVLEGISRNISALSDKVAEIERAGERLKRQVNEYNNSRYNGV